MDRRNNVDVILETLAPHGKRIVDVGCGNGHLSRRLALAGALVLGIECSPRQLAKARTLPPTNGLEIVAGTGQALPVADAYADAVVFFNSLHHIPPSAMVVSLAEAARVLKSDGLVYVSEPIAEGRFFATCRPVDDETQLRAEAQAAIQTAVERGILGERHAFRYLHTVELESFEAFRERIVSANSERDARFEAMEAEMREVFGTNAIRNAAGKFCFDQPMQVHILHRSLV